MSRPLWSDPAPSTRERRSLQSALAHWGKAGPPSRRDFDEPKILQHLDHVVEAMPRRCADAHEGVTTGPSNRDGVITHGRVDAADASLVSSAIA
jgi:hypothetical protein